jgi:hypothetical protein
MVKEDQVICRGDTINIGYGNNINSFEWKSNPEGFHSLIANPEVAPESTITYILTEHLSEYDCSFTDSVKIIVNPGPDFSWGITTNPINPGNNSTIDLSGALAYNWHPSDNITQITASVFNAAPLENTEYIVTGFDSDGCKTDKMIEILVYCDNCGDNALFSSSGHFNHGCFNQVYRNNSICTWTIFPAGEMNEIIIEFSLDSFDIKEGDYLRVFEGTDTTGELIGSYNNKNRPPASIIIPGSSTYIYFLSNSSEAGRGFQAYYTANSTSTDDLAEKSLKIYPNPFNNRTIIEFSNPDFEEYQLIVTNLTGKIFWHQYKITEDRIEFDRTGIPSGTYLLELIGPKVYRSKIIIE